MGGSTDRAGREWLEFIADLIERPLTELPAEAVALRLMDTLRADGCAFTSSVTISGAGMWPDDFWGDRSESGIAARVAQESLSAHPVVRYFSATGRVEAVQIADVPAAFHMRWRSEGWESYYRSFGAGHHLSIPVASGDGFNRAFVLGRSTPYSEPEMELARTVRRLLVGLRTQIDALSTVALRGASPDAAAGLTPREIGILALVADGLTATATARRLGISVHTVNKHLQNTYAKLGATNRVAALSQARLLGAL
jgi:DNA-binding CsgD family transcriptional regulator